jgi:endonuclease/exonuclease/phosphatase family metal-dependent hydrolase
MKSGLKMVFLNALHNTNRAGYPVPRWSASSELKILSWNIYMLPYISLFNNNDKRARAIAERLNGSDYHIIVFQEAFSSKCRNIMSEILLASFPFQYGPVNDAPFSLRTNSGLWIVSKFPLTKLDQLEFSKSRGFDAVARKGAVLFEGIFKGSKFQLLATHLQAEDSQELREMQCAEIREHLLNPYFHRDTPQFLCGDFNIDMHDTNDYHRMLQILDATNGNLSGNILVTYDEIDNDLAFKANGKRKILDYALVRNDALIEKTDRKVHAFFSNIGEVESPLSDHYAMELNVNFTEIKTI